MVSGHVGMLNRVVKMPKATWFVSEEARQSDSSDSLLSSTLFHHKQGICPVNIY